jgi:extracellular elastinolytic metalloproteinase
VFDYVPDGGAPVDFRDAAVTQAFYTTNMLHDLYYLFGFTPAAGNFQLSNGEEGGKANDPVDVLIQHYAGKNNGLFSQTVDGRSPTLTMYVFDKTDPYRDGAFDQGFLIHEYTHGRMFFTPHSSTFYSKYDWYHVLTVLNCQSLDA